MSCPVGFHFEQISVHQREPVDTDRIIMACVED